MFAGVRRILLDLSGTLHIENDLIPGALEALAAARAAGLQVDFVSNTSKEGRRDLLARLDRLGLRAADQTIRLHTSLSVTAESVRRRRLRPLLLLSESAKADFLCQQDGEDHAVEGEFNSVVVGLAPECFCYGELNRAMQLLLEQPGAPLLATHRGRYLRKLDGRLHLGPGPFVAALEFATGRTAEMFGKPSAEFFKSVLGPSDALEPACAVMIGDDAADDASGAVRCGLRAILVRTGKFRPGDEAPPAAAAPTAVCNDVLDAVRVILRDQR